MYKLLECKVIYTQSNFDDVMVLNLMKFEPAFSCARISKDIPHNGYDFTLLTQSNRINYKRDSPNPHTQYV